MYGNAQRGKQRNSQVLVGMRSAPRPRKSLSKFHRDPELRLNALASRLSRPPAVTELFAIIRVPVRNLAQRLRHFCIERLHSLAKENGEEHGSSPVKSTFETQSRNPAAKPTA